MLKVRMTVVAVVFFLLLGGCSLSLVPEGTPVMKLEYSLDGVKVISPSIARGDDASAWGRDVYELAPDRRLLLRLESLSRHTNMISLDSERTVLVRVRLADADRIGTDRSALRLCPITKSWMMLATWFQAEPFGASGRWSTPGGDLDDAGCVIPSVRRRPAPSAEPAVPAAEPEDPQLVTFDVRQWFLNYARGRNSNYGLILIADRPVRVNGEASGPHSPRIEFSRWVPAERLPAEPVPAVR